MEERLRFFENRMLRKIFGAEVNRERRGLYRCHRRNGPNFRRVFLMLNYTDITQNTYPKLNGYGDNGQRKVWTTCISTYCTSTAV